MHENVALWYYQGLINSTGVYNALIYRICIYISVFFSHLHIPALVMHHIQNPLVLYVSLLVPFNLTFKTHRLTEISARATTSKVTCIRSLLGSISSSPDLSVTESMTKSAVMFGSAPVSRSWSMVKFTFIFS